MSAVLISNFWVTSHFNNTKIDSLLAHMPSQYAVGALSQWRWIEPMQVKFC